VGIWSRLFGPRAALPGPGDDFWYQAIGQTAASGERVSPESALTHSAVYACVKVVSETCAGLPWIVYRRLPDGGKERAPDHRVQRILNRPNPWQTKVEFAEQVIGAYSLRGNGYAEYLPSQGWLVPRHNDRVARVERAGDGSKRYVLRETDGSDRPVAQAFMWHPHEMSVDGLVGLSKLEQAKDAIGNALAARKFGGKFFANSARPSGVVKRPGDVDALNPEATRKLAASLQAQMNGENAATLLLLQEGMTFEKLTLNPDDAQFIETMQFGVEDIARFWRMPLHKIGHLLRSTFSNIEHQAIEFVTDTIAPHCARLEQSLSRLLFTEEEQDEFFIEFLLEGLLRGDTLARYQAYQLGLSSGWLTRNEVRTRENLNPLPGLDEPLQALNMGNPGGNPERTRQAEPPTDEGEDEDDA
jgi:HK97 family phage portal protein